jgi:3-isopropylmalate/(R)-2-methylmalate dehydratase small subunit
VVLSSRFADIFRGNAGNGGLVAAAVPQPAIEALWAAIDADRTTAVTVDLESRTVSWGDTTVPFEIDDYTRWRLLEGLDDIDLTLRHADEIARFEQRRPAWMPATG